mmetsp:Transcript_26996/g.59832  ORF Transcript_26996/g.59832 Transcript_26996/m.59832 type:complete len:196 (-) Transcript_26996:120-707(-)
MTPNANATIPCTVTFWRVGGLQCFPCLELRRSTRISWQTNATTHASIAIQSHMLMPSTQMLMLSVILSRISFWSSVPSHCTRKKSCHLYSAHPDSNRSAIDKKTRYRLKDAARVRFFGTLTSGRPIATTKRRERSMETPTKKITAVIAIRELIISLSTLLVSGRLAVVVEFMIVLRGHSCRPGCRILRSFRAVLV